MSKIEIIRLDNDGLRIGISRGSEMRGAEETYDPWLRIPEEEARCHAKVLTSRYISGLVDQVMQDINAGGANHINRILFETLWAQIGPDRYEKFAGTVMQVCSNKVGIMLRQIYAHRLYEDQQIDRARTLLHDSIAIAQSMSHKSWAKWVASGYFFLARYNDDEATKGKYCIATLLKPATLNFSPHMKYWKLFRVAAWLVGHRISTDKAQAAIARYKALEFCGYEEHRGGGVLTFLTHGVLDNPVACLQMMYKKSGARHVDDP